MPNADKQEKKQNSPPEGKSAAAEKAVAQPDPAAARNPKRTGAKNNGLPTNMDFLLDIPLEISVELGRTKMLINDLLQLGQGSVIELSKLAGEALDIFANQKLVARGEVVVVNEKYGIRLSEIISPTERIKRLK